MDYMNSSKEEILKNINKSKLYKKLFKEYKYDNNDNNVNNVKPKNNKINLISEINKYYDIFFDESKNSNKNILQNHPLDEKKLNNSFENNKQIISNDNKQIIENDNNKTTYIVNFDEKYKKKYIKYKKKYFNYKKKYL